MDKDFFKKYSKYNLLIFFLIITGLSLYIILPFLTVIFAAAIITYIFYPEFRRLNKYIKSKSICALLMVLIILLIIIIPVFLIINALAIEAVSFYQNVKTIDLTPVSALLSKFVQGGIDVNIYIKDIASSVVSFIIRSASDFFFALPQKVLILFVTIFIMYYFFKDGDKMVNLFGKLFPIKADHRNELLAEFKKVIYATIYGVIVSAAIQGLIGTLGLIIFDVSSPILWGSIMVLTAIIPFIGTWLIWLPAALFKIFNGDFFNGFGLLVYGILIVSLIDNFIKPKLISGKSKIHPVLIILGVFGGLKVFGLIGVMLGPLILAMLFLIYSFYIKRI